MKNTPSPKSKKPDPIDAYYRARQLLNAEKHEGSEPLTKRVKSALEKTLENNRRPAASVRLALWQQRQETTDLLQKSNSYAPHVLEGQKGREGSPFRVYLERAFSDPSDYLFPVKPLTREQRREVLSYLILYPNHIPDPLFLDIAGISESDWKNLSLTERMESKRKNISHLKELFMESVSLTTRTNGGTGRVVRLPYHPAFPHVAGSYLVFQEFNMLDGERISSRESRKNTVTAKMIPDVWSLARSQFYASESLREKICLIGECQARLKEIRIRYTDASPDERKEMIVGFASKFSQKHAYAFKKIIAVRKPRIKYTNSRTDDSVLMGITNDLESYYLELVSKRSQILRQEQLLREMADGHSTQFFFFFDRFYRELSTFDSTDLEKRILDTDTPNGDLKFTTEESRRIGKIWHEVRLFENILSNPVEIGAPFFEIESRIQQAVGSLR